MLKNISLIVVASLVLGGCTLPSFLNQNEDAATDVVETSTPPSPSPSAVEDTKDEALEQMPPVQTNNDLDSIEKDLNNTSILNEDFSDLN